MMIMIMIRYKVYDEKRQQILIISVKMKYQHDDDDDSDNDHHHDVDSDDDDADDGIMMIAMARTAHCKTRNIRTSMTVKNSEDKMILMLGKLQSHLDFCQIYS